MLPQLDPEHIIALHCPLCPFLTLSVTRLFEHCMTHNAPCECTLLQCADCGKVSTHEGLLREHAAALHDGKQMQSLQRQQQANEEPRSQRNQTGIKRLSVISLNGGGSVSRDGSSSWLSVGDGDSTEPAFNSIDNQQQEGAQSQFACLFCDAQLQGLQDLELHCDSVHGLRQINVKTMHSRLQQLVAKTLLSSTNPPLGGFLAAAAAAAAAVVTATPTGQTQSSILESSYARQQLDPSSQREPQAASHNHSRSGRHHHYQQQIQQASSVSLFPSSNSAGNRRASPLIAQGQPAAAPVAKRMKLEPLNRQSPDLASLSVSGVEAAADVAEDSAASMSGDQSAAASAMPSASPPAPLSASSLSFLTAPRGVPAASVGAAPTPAGSMSMTPPVGAGGSAGRPSLLPLGVRLAELGGELLEDQAPYSTRCTYCGRVVRLSSRSCTNFKIHRQRCQEHLATSAGNAGTPASASWAAAATGESGENSSRDADVVSED